MSTTFADNLRFLRALITRPKNVGAVLPSGPALANAMARQITAQGPVLELGPGTGAITAAILEHGTPPESLFGGGVRDPNGYELAGVHAGQHRDCKQFGRARSLGRLGCGAQYRSTAKGMDGQQFRSRAGD